MSTAAAKILDIHFDPDCSAEQIRQVLSTLDRESITTGKPARHTRRSYRHLYRTTVIVERHEAADSAELVRRQVFHVAARNVSTSGLGFIAPAIFVPRKLSEELSLIRAEDVFRIGMPIKVTLCRTPGKMPVLDGSIIRIRPVAQAFFEIGVQFAPRDLAAREKCEESAADNATNSA